MAKLLARRLTAWHPGCFERVIRDGTADVIKIKPTKESNKTC
jgi:hypothetical protein